MKRLHAILFLLLPMFCSCLGSPPEQWSPEDVPMCSTMRLWEITRLAMEKNGFPVVHQGFDPKTKAAISGWKKDLHPFKGHGTRERIHVRYKRSEAAGMLTIGVRVEQELNDNLSHPLDPSYAKWIEAPDNTGRALVVLQYIRSLLGDDLELGETLTEEELQEKLRLEGPDF